MLINPSNNKFRLRRFSYFLCLISDMDRQRPLRILDVGGERRYWLDKLDLLRHPVKISILNLYDPTGMDQHPEIESLTGDARDMSDFPDNSFDVVHSNSVIEHVGRWSDMKAMANEIRRLAPAYFVQTPYFWFPVEPHFRSVGFHWLPEAIRVRKLMSHKHGFVKKAENIDEAIRAVQSSCLLDRKMMASLFPDAQIIFEKFLGLPKSIMAIRKV
jgi:hypothetical protein